MARVGTIAAAVAMAMFVPVGISMGISVGAPVAGQQNPGAPAGPLRDKIVEIARREQKAGVNEGNCSNLKYHWMPGGGGCHMAWCAAFAGWVWKEAGVPKPPGYGVFQWVDWAKPKGLLKRDNPKPGDTVIYATSDQASGWGGIQHIGVVVEVSGTGRTDFVSIEGNTAEPPDNRVAFRHGKKKRSCGDGPSDHCVFGFVAPEGAG